MNKQIFDEADRLQDMGFEREMKESFEIIKSKVLNFDDLNIFMVSATTGGKIESLSKDILGSFKIIGESEDSIQSAKGIIQFALIVPSDYRILYLLLFLYLKRKFKVFDNQIIIFVSTCQTVNFIYDLIKGLDWSTFFIDQNSSNVKK